MKTFVASCDRAGVIRFTRRLPRGTVPLLRGPLRTLRNRIEPVARHAYDGKTLLVPGVPEAPNENAAMDALIRWADWLGLRKQRRA